MISTVKPAAKQALKIAQQARTGKKADHFEAHVILEEDIVVLADGKVVWVEEGLLHGEGLPCHLLPLLVILIDLNLHLRASHWLYLTASERQEM